MAQGRWTRAWLACGALALGGCGGGGTADDTSAAPVLSDIQKAGESLFLHRPGYVYYAQKGSVSDFFYFGGVALDQSPATATGYRVTMTRTTVAASPNLPGVPPRDASCATLTVGSSTVGAYTVVVAEGKGLVKLCRGQPPVIEYSGTDMLRKLTDNSGGTAQTLKVTAVSLTAPTPFAGNNVVTQLKAWDTTAGVQALAANAATFATGSDYGRGTGVLAEDFIEIFDWNGARLEPADVRSAPKSGSTTPATTLAELWPVSSSSDGRVYTENAGTKFTYRGYNAWRATARRFSTGTPTYRIYIEIGGKVYTGELMPAGTELGQSYFNATAMQSIVDAKLSWPN